MFSKIFNYVIKSIIVLIGILITLGIIFKDYFPDSEYRFVVGLVITLFGIYRILMYRLKTKTYDFSIKNEESDE